jgi:hypothetical protein
LCFAAQLQKCISAKSKFLLLFFSCPIRET